MDIDKKFIIFYCNTLNIQTTYIRNKINKQNKLSINYTCSLSYPVNRINGVIACVLASSVVDHGFESGQPQTKDYETGICCFSAKQAALRKKSKDWLARNENNVPEWIRVITKLPNSEQSYKGKVKTHNYINRQNQSTTGKL